MARPRDPATFRSENEGVTFRPDELALSVPVSDLDRIATQWRKRAIRIRELPGFGTEVSEDKALVLEHCAATIERACQKVTIAHARSEELERLEKRRA